MLNKKVIFLNSGALVSKEIETALNKNIHVQLINIKTVTHPTVELVEKLFEKIKQYLPAIVISTNDTGYDMDGVLSKLFADSGSYQINWYHDSPFYEILFHNRATPAFKNRIDLISDPSYLEILKAKGYNSFFLPLATDPQFFNMDKEASYKRDIAFVGNSSLKFMDFIITEKVSKELEKNGLFLNKAKKAYFNKPNLNVFDYIYKHKKEWKNKINIPEEVFVFCIEWLVGFFYRRDFIVSIANKYKEDFTIYGDPYWTRFVKKELVSNEVGYYTNLCEYYRSTKVNLNVNRIQIRTAFTQRPFDCKASGSFLLTDKRLCNSDFFVTGGANKEIVEFSSLNECKKLVDYYIKHTDEREKIALAGREKILKYHTYDNRISEILDIANKVWGI